MRRQTKPRQIDCGTIFLVIHVSVLRCMVIAMLCAPLYSTPAHAQWNYSLATQVAVHDVALSTCGKVEPGINAVLSDDLAKLVHYMGLEAIRSARKSSEYLRDYHAAMLEQLTARWGDAEEEAHNCERIYLSRRNSVSRNPWWQDRRCVNVPLNSEEDSGYGQRCGAGPGAQVSFEKTVTDVVISVLRLAPSSDVSFPRAGKFWSQPGYRIVSSNNAGRVWAIPESVEIEWKEWPRKIPGEVKDEHDLQRVRLYVDDVRRKVKRKRATLVVRGRIPPEVIAESLQAEQTVGSGQAGAGSLKLFFIFMPDGLRFRWEQWNGKCIKKYGGDEIDLPRNRLLSGDWVCSEPEPLPCGGCGTNANSSRAPFSFGRFGSPTAPILPARPRP